MRWDTTSLGEFMDVKHGFAFKGESFADSGDYILLTPGNCHESGGLKLKGDREKYYSGEFPDEFLLHEGDLLVVMTDLINSAPILGGSFQIPEDNRFLHNQRLGLVRITDSRRIDKGFLYYLLNTEPYRGQIRGSASGATVRHTSPGRIKECVVRVPRDVGYQTKVAGILSAYDEAMENNRRRMGLVERAVRLLYEEWFVRLRFPGYEHTPIKHGLPQGWEKKCLDQVAEVNRASLPGSHDGEIEYVDISAVVPGQITKTSILEFREAPSRARRIVQHGDIIWSCVRPNRRSHAVIWNPPGNLIVSTGFAAITPTAVPTSFLYCATTTDAFVGYLEKHAKGAAYPAVVAGDFERASVVLPSKQLLKSFNEIVAPMFSQVQNLRLQNQKLRAARDLLLPRLMSGEIEV